MTKESPLLAKHKELNAKIVDFAGWQMPIHYTSIAQEHDEVRQNAGLFDISHMGQVHVWGDEAAAYLYFLLTSDIDKLPINKGQYSHMCNTKGGVIDDVFVYKVEDDRFIVVVNASRTDVDLAWMEKQARSFEIDLKLAPKTGGLALQGPKAADIIYHLSPQAASLSKRGINEFEIQDRLFYIGRTGYTGEDGFEIFGAADAIVQIWDRLLQEGKDLGIKPCGLGARDTLRTEMAYPLYGHELDEEHTPFEAGLDWVVKLTKEDFIGKDALQNQQDQGLKKKLAGFEVLSGGIARPEGQIFVNDQAIGTVASGTYSPTLKKSIGLAYLPIEHTPIQTKLIIKQGDRSLDAQVVPTPFIKKPVLTESK